MFDYKVKIGLIAMRRNTTDRPKGTFLTWHSAEERGKRFTQYIEENFSNDNVEFADNKGIGIKDLVFDDDSAKKVIKRFKDEKVDAVFIINCNFGNEEAAADIAKELDKPVMIAEDFSFYQEKVPGVFFFLGTGSGIPLHSVNYDMDDSVIIQGVKLFEAILKNL